jgi:photosystem II stability/assembly factor-like uncharacterized protein
LNADYRWAIALASLILAFSTFASAQEEPPSAQETQPPRRERRRDDPRRRMEWFYRQRAFPLGRIPAGARQKALEQMEEMRRRESGRTSTAAPREALAAAGNVDPSWTPIGPQPVESASFFVVSGRVTALAVNPQNPKNVYLGAAEGGVWLTTDGGMTWKPLTDFQASLAVGSIALDPTTCTSTGCNTIYVGTGEENFAGDSYYGAGILKSTDGGNTWAQLGQSTFVGPINSFVGGAHIGSLAIQPNKPQVLLAGVQKLIRADTGTSSGVYRSPDGGQSWMQVISGAAGTEVLFDPSSCQPAAPGQPPPPCVAYAALGSPGGDPQNGIYKSSDGGVTWCALSPGTTPQITPAAGCTAATGLPATNIGRIQLAIAAPPSTSTIYASIADASTASNNLLGMFKTTNSGQSWTQLTTTPDYCQPQCWYDNVVRVHPNNASVIYAGGSATSFSTGGYLVRSTTGGSSWSGIALGANSVRIHVDIHALAFGFTGTTATQLYVGNDGGIWSTDVSNATGAINWSDLNGPLEITQFYPGHSIHPSSQNIGIGGTQDNGTLNYVGILPWVDTDACGDGGWTAIDPAVPSTVYATCENIDVEKSYQNGQRDPVTGRTSFIESDSGIDQNDFVIGRVEFIPPFVIDPNNPQRLYFGTFRVYQTNDSARSWTAISLDLPGGADDLTAVAVAPSDSNTVYAGTSNGLVFVTNKAGDRSAVLNSWTKMNAMLPTRFVTQLAVDPTLSSTAYVTFSGFAFGTDKQGHVFKTINGGIFWQDISCSVPDCTAPGPTDLPNIPVNDIVIDPAAPNTLYVGTDVGVFSTSNGGATWSTLVTGLPRVAVLGLKLRRASRTLRAATHGRSVWDLQLADSRTFFLSSLSPVTDPVGRGDLPLVVSGGGFTMSSVVLWNGQKLATTFATANQLTATVPASNLASAITAQVSVSDPSQPSPTNSLVFTVTAAAPTTTSISPTTAAQGSPGFTLTVNGTNFASNSVVRFNGNDRTTTFVSATQVTAAIPASDLAVGGFFPVTVFVPPPGGGESNTQNFIVTAPPPPNDNFANAIIVTGTSFTDMENSEGATIEATDPAPPCVAGQGAVANGTAKSIWYKFTAPSAGTVEADTIGSAYDTILSAWTGGPGAFTSVACNDDISPGIILTSRVTFSAVGGTTYFFMISAFDGSGGATTFHMSFTPTPDFSIAATTTTVMPISPGAGAVYTITITPMNGFTGTVTPSCSTSSTLVTCGAFSPATIIPPTTQSTLTVTANSSAFLPEAPPTGSRPRWPSGPSARWLEILLGVALIAGWMAARAGAPHKTRRLAYAFAGALVLFLGLQFAGCGGGGGGGGGTRAPRSYTITFTGTSGSLSHSVNATLTVQ